MVSFSKLVLGALAVIAGVVAQTTYPVSVSVPIEGVATPYDITFDLLAENSILNAARQLCLQKAGEIGVTTNEVLNQVCIPAVEQHITAVLLANKIVERKVPTQVTMSIPFTDKGSYSITFDPTKSTSLQLGEYLCVEKQAELGITSQDQFDSCKQGVAKYVDANYQAQTAPMKAAPVTTSERKPNIKSITIPTTVGDLPLTVDINSVTANQAAEHVCRQHAAKIGITTMDGLNTCIPPISAYIQQVFGTQSRPPITMTMNANNMGEFEFSFDPSVPVNTVANDLCMLKAQDFGITTQEQLLQNCIPPVAQYINSVLSGRKA